MRPVLNKNHIYVDSNTVIGPGIAPRPEHRPVDTALLMEAFYKAVRWSREDEIALVQARRERNDAHTNVTNMLIKVSREVNSSINDEDTDDEKLHEISLAIKDYETKVRKLDSLIEEKKRKQQLIQQP